MAKSSKINLIQAISIGVGGMVGGGIFAVLGLSVDLAGGGVLVSFLVAGIIAAITAYSYAKWSVAYPDSGGTVRFLNEGFGNGLLSGGLGNTLWVSYIIMLALYASAFGAYGSSLIHITGDKSLDAHILLSAILVISTAINYYSITVVGKVESIAVIVKLLILISFVVVGFFGLSDNPNFAQLDVSSWESPIALIAAGMIIFVAYEGFELIANSSPDISNPKRNIPLAFGISVVFVILLYLAIAAVTVGSVAFEDISAAQDYALAVAAKPKFGEVGFVVIGIAAMISTFSAINATILGGSRVNYEVAEDDELPSEFTRFVWGKPVGLAVISVAALVLANTVDLESISSSGSMGFLIIFGMVNVAAFRKSKEIGSNKLLSLIGGLLCFIAFAILVNQQAQTNALGVGIALAIIALCFIGEFLFRKARR